MKRLTFVKGIKRTIVSTIVVAALLLTSSSFGAELSPEATVSAYYEAVKNGRFEQSYDYVSQGMKGDRTREQWAADWRGVFESGKVVIFEVSVSPAKIEGEKATVHVSNRSSCILDKKTHPEGVMEDEIDSLIKEKGIWKIDRTEVVFEDVE